jgi:hypothetical protein
MRQQLQDSNMKTKTLLGTLAVAGLLALGAKAEVNVITTDTNGPLSEPYDVVEDAYNNAYVSSSAYNCIVRIDAITQAASVLTGVSGVRGTNDGPASGFSPALFFDPQGLLVVSIGGANGLLVTDSGNNLIRFARLSDGYVTTLAGQVGGGPANNAAGANATFRFPIGMDQDTNGNVYIADFNNSAIRVMNLNDPAFGVTNLVITGTTLIQPAAVAYAGNNQLWIADSYNNTIKLITLTTPTTGSLTTYMGTNSHSASGTADSPFGPTARFNGPRGLLWLNGLGLLISDTGNDSIRLATNNPVYGATNYGVGTFAGMAQQAGLVDGLASLAKFNSPVGLCPDIINGGILVADRANNAMRRIQTGAPLPPVPTPAIGWVDYQIDTYGDYTSVLRTQSPFIFHNDVTIAIAGTTGTETFYTYGATPPLFGPDTIPDPNALTGITLPWDYQDGLFPYQIQNSMVPPLPDLTIKAIGVASGRRNSSISSARFKFVTANPLISGNNAAQFTVTDITTNAFMFYTTDGTDPTNTSQGPIFSGQTMSFSSNLTYKVIAMRGGYENSAVVSKIFAASNFVPNQISFGFPSGEASSDFVAAPGQVFYAPITLTLLPDQKIYSLQFSVTVTNAGPKPGPPVFPGAVFFQSSLLEPHPTIPDIFIVIPPAMFLGLVTNIVVVTNCIDYLDDPCTNFFLTTNILSIAPINPPPGELIIYPFANELPFLDLEFVDSAINLIGVGWLERRAEKSLYDTTKQDLITYSEAHDVMHLSRNGLVEVGDYGFWVPPSATNGQTYQIQIIRQSATSDGIGAPGADVYLNAPTNGSPTNGAINSIKTVTVGQRKYLVGDVYPFRWFNAGDFGNTNLENADVMQVFESAIYGLDYPPWASDFFDAMDSCGGYYVDNGHGYLEFDGYVTDTNALNLLFDWYEDDVSINDIAFGDGVLDVCDVFVTFRRSLDPSLYWFRRFFTNDIANGVQARVAEIVPNYVAPHLAAGSGRQSKIGGSTTNPPLVNFAAADVIASPGQVVPIPITANIFGGHPLRMVLLNLTVNPLDGSPALTTPVQFIPNPALGSAIGSDMPLSAVSADNGNYAAVWLPDTNTLVSQLPGLTGNATIGTLMVTIPADATSSSAYAVHFDHASASPNGVAAFPKHTLTGLITLSSRTNSYYHDGIPDSWRLRYFGTIYNLLSVSNADADGDGFKNWQERVAGTDPTDPKSCLRLAAGSLDLKNRNSMIHWPSVGGKQYVIERSTSLFPPSWTPIATNTGTGTDMEFDDATGGSIRFYRVQVLP